MKGLLIKEFIMLKKNWLVMFLFAGVFGVIGIISGFPSMLILISLFITIYQSNHITVDEQCKWQQYAIALPYGRRNIISSKYVYTAIISLCSTVYISICYTISAIIGRIDFSFAEFLMLMLFSVVAGLIYPTIILPISYKFNSEKGRIFLMFINGCSGGLFACFMTDGRIFDSLVELNNVANFLPFITFALVIVLYMISWKISIRIYEKRDL